jgi:hypothetical protein
MFADSSLRAFAHSRIPYIGKRIRVARTTTSRFIPAERGEWDMGGGVKVPRFFPAMLRCGRPGYPAELRGRAGRAKLFRLLRELQETGLVTEATVKNANRHPVGVWQLTDAGRSECERER